MKKVSLLSMAVVTALGVALSGCSSGGGGDSPSSSAAQNAASSQNISASQTSGAAQVSGASTASPSSQASGVAQTQNSAASSNGAASKINHTTPLSGGNTASKAKFNGVAYHFKSPPAADKIASPQLMRISSDNVDVLYADGKRIVMAPQKALAEYTFISENDDKVLKLSLGTKDRKPILNSQVGMYQDRRTGDTYVYTQGELTPEDRMPKSGKINYYAFGPFINNQILDYPVVLYRDPPLGRIVQLTLEADFDAKTVDGEILSPYTDRSNGEVRKLSGKITGNRFSGVKDGTRTEGVFYTDGTSTGMAQEIGGIYVNEQEGFSGAFAGKADKNNLINTVLGK